jgi:hypothetical protein
MQNATGASPSGGIMYIFRKKPNQLENYVRIFVEDRGKNYKEHIQLFMEMNDKHITEITEEDVYAYVDRINSMYQSDYFRINGIRALNCFLRYWRARGHKYLMQIPRSCYNNSVTR